MCVESSAAEFDQTNPRWFCQNALGKAIGETLLVGELAGNTACHWRQNCSCVRENAAGSFGTAEESAALSPTQLQFAKSLSEKPATPDGIDACRTFRDSLKR